MIYRFYWAFLIIWAFLSVFIGQIRRKGLKRRKRREKRHSHLYFPFLVPFTLFSSSFPSFPPYQFFQTFPKKKSPVHNEVNRGKVAGKGRVD